MLRASSQGSPANTTFYSLTAITCLVLLIGIVSCVIVLALIPIYINRSTVARNDATQKSQEATMSVEVEQDHSFVKRRSGRAVGDLDELVGTDFDDAGLEMMKSTLRSYLNLRQVYDLVITKVSVGYKATTGTKRLAMLKRRNHNNIPVVLIIKFYIIYPPSCPLTCQDENAGTVRTTFYNLPVQSIYFTNVRMNRNGVYSTTASRIQFVAIVYVSEIISALRDLQPTIPVLTQIPVTDATTPNTYTTNLLG